MQNSCLQQASLFLKVYVVGKLILYQMICYLPPLRFYSLRWQYMANRQYSESFSGCCFPDLFFSRETNSILIIFCKYKRTQDFFQAFTFFDYFFSSSQSVAPCFFLVNVVAKITSNVVFSNTPNKLSLLYMFNFLSHPQ